MLLSKWLFSVLNSSASFKGGLRHVSSTVVIYSSWGAFWHYRKIRTSGKQDFCASLRGVEDRLTSQWALILSCMDVVLVFVVDVFTGR